MNSAKSSTEMGKIKTYLGDCIDIMSTLEESSIDMVLCDLPYGTTSCKWDVIIPFEQLWEQYARVCKENAAILLFGTEPFSSHLRLSNLKYYRHDWIWEKERPTNIFHMKKQVGKVHEIISVFYQKQPIYNPIMEERQHRTIGVFGKEQKSKTHENQTYRYSEDYDRTKVYPRSVLKINRDTLKGSKHPTQKPIELCEYMIKTYSNEGDWVLDNTMGSGSTLIAAVNQNRNAIGIESDKNFYEVAQQRLKDETTNSYHIIK